jgi:hypothetical protein
LPAIACLVLLLTALRAAAQPAEALLSPYATDSEHLWNRLHRALFVRTTKQGAEYVHSVDPFLFENGSFLLEGEPHHRALALLDEFLSAPAEQMFDDSQKRRFLQHDLWAAFDYLARPPYPWDDHPAHEAAGAALRTRLAKIIDRLSLDDSQINSLPDNYALAVKSQDFPADYDPQHPEEAFLPADLFDPAGPWVRFTDSSGQPIAPQHFKAVSGRSVHIVFLRLPDGRDATLRFLKELRHDSITQFPRGTMVAMVRRAMAIDRSTKIRVTPVTEMVQIRVYRRIPDDPKANFHGDSGEQDVCEFVLDRAKLFAGEHGLHAVESGDPPEPFERDGDDAFTRRETDTDANNPLSIQGMNLTALKSCISCHQAPGIYSVISIDRRLQHDSDGEEPFVSYSWESEMHHTQVRKIRRYDWGLLQGMIEATREARK